jgi:hypothetical protein
MKKHNSSKHILVSGILLLERTFNLTIEDAYTKLKATLVEKGCKVISEDPQNQIRFKQGSLWGIAPQTAKKTITSTLEAVEGGTRVMCSSKLASDWKNITIVGCAFAAVLLGLCLWMASDLSGFIVSREPSFWSWLVVAGSNINLAAAKVFVNLTWGLASFLSLIILLEIVIVVYANFKIDLFTEEALKTLD